MQRKRILALLLSVALTLVMLTPVALAADFGDTAGHWAEDVIGTWSDYGILKGSDGKFRPNDFIKRSEMATVLSNIIGYTKTVSNPFSDVSSADWFYQDILKLNAAGVMLGSGGLATPHNYITRQEAAVMIARAFGIAENAGAADSFPDAADIAVWAKPLVGGLKAKGFVSGDDTGNFAPLSNITRAAAVKLIDNIIGGFYSTAGQYSGSVTGNVVVNKSGVTLKNMTISGDLYIMEGVGAGEVTLDGVKVSGKTFVRGGGENSIIITGDSDIGEVVVTKTESGAIRVYVSGNANVSVVYVDDGLDGVVIEGNVGSVVLDANVDITLTGGTVGSVTVSDAAEGANIAVSSTSTVNELNVSTPNAVVEVAGTVNTVTVNANNVKIETTASAKIEDVVVNASNVSVEGTGAVTQVKVESGSGNKVTTPDSKVDVSSGAGSVTTNEGTVDTGSSGSSGTETSSGGTSGGGGTGGTGGNDPVAPTPAQTARGALETALKGSASTINTTYSNLVNIDTASIGNQAASGTVTIDLKGTVTSLAGTGILTELLEYFDEGVGGCVITKITINEQDYGESDLSFNDASAETLNGKAVIISFKYNDSSTVYTKTITLNIV